ncbi:hypothetical protein EDC04DRAFT_1926230 [Pisolithus marmoratus]|nr:hypothetical protein EDC04DRAFT_1926230 [Pisolithus marmoratus]
MNTYQTHPGTPQQAPGQYPLSQQPMSYSGAGMGMHMAPHNMAMNPSSSLDMNINASGNMGMNLNMGPSNMPMNLANTPSNPVYLAMFNAQQNSNSMNGMMNKFPYPSYSNQSQQQGQQSMALPHSQMPNMGSQMHASHGSNNMAAMQNNGQSISPTQLMSASPSQFMSGPSSQQQQQSHAHSLNLTPAQLLHQQQSGAINPASLVGGAGNLNMGGLNSNLGNMGAGMSMGVNMGGLGNSQNMVNAGSMNMQGMPNMGSVPNQRMNIPPNVNSMRIMQMTPHERQAIQRQHAASLGHGLPSDRGLSATPSQSGHERGPSLTHERPPAQHERAQSLTHERHPSQQPHERAPSQPRDSTGLPSERPSSSASVRSHHSHHNLDAVAPHGMMGPPGSRPGTASGTMTQLTRMNSMNSGTMHMSSGGADQHERYELTFELLRKHDVADEPTTTYEYGGGHEPPNDTNGRRRWDGYANEPSTNEDRFCHGLTKAFPANGLERRRPHTHGHGRWRQHGQRYNTWNGRCYWWSRDEWYECWHPR